MDKIIINKRKRTIQATTKLTPKPKVRKKSNPSIATNGLNESGKNGEFEGRDKLLKTTTII